MPDSISLGLLVLGGVLILIGFLGGNFKLFGAEVASTISNRWLRFTAIVFGIVLLIAAGSFSTPPNPSATTPSPSATTPSPSATTPSPSATTPSPSATVSVDRFVGQWSSEGDVRASHLIKLELQLQNSKLSGTLEARSYKDESSSGILSIVSDTNEKPLDIEIFDQKGYAVGKAELELNENVLVWRLIRAQSIAEATLPSIAYLYKL